MNLGDEAAEIGTLAIEFLGVGELFGLSSRLGRCGSKRRSRSRSRICGTLNSWFRLGIGLRRKYGRLCKCKGSLFRNFSFDNAASSVLKLFAILGLLEVDNRREFNFVLVRGTQLLFNLVDLGAESEGLKFEFFLSISILFNILVCELAVGEPSFWVRSNVFDELRLGFREKRRKRAVALHTEGRSYVMSRA